MRITVVKKHLPLGVVLATTAAEHLFDRLMPIAQLTERRSSNKPLELALEVPVGKERETAKALRDLAEELEQ